MFNKHIKLVKFSRNKSNKTTFILLGLIQHAIRFFKFSNLVNTKVYIDGVGVVNKNQVKDNKTKTFKWL